MFWHLSNFSLWHKIIPLKPSKILAVASASVLKQITNLWLFGIRLCPLTLILLPFENTIPQMPGPWGGLHPLLSRRSDDMHSAQRNDKKGEGRSPYQEPRSCCHGGATSVHQVRVILGCPSATITRTSLASWTNAQNGHSPTQIMSSATVPEMCRRVRILPRTATAAAYPMGHSRQHIPHGQQLSPTICALRPKMTHGQRKA